jgi:hypothetical protein
MGSASSAKEKARPLRDEPDGRDATLHTVFYGQITLPIRPGLLVNSFGGRLRGPFGVCAWRRFAANPALWASLDAY